MKRINWIPGWASRFSVWKDEIEATFPEYQHIFWQYEELKIFEDQETLDSITMKFRDDIFIGWSLGSQLIFENAESFSHIKKIICLAPVFEFCHEPYGWKPKIIDRMISQLKSDPETVLNQFAQNMGDNVNTPQWLEYAKSQTLENLIWGLEKLKSGKIENLSPLQDNTRCIYGKNDKIVPFNLVNSFTDTFNFITFNSCDTMEHWPLTDESTQRIKEILNEQN